MRKVRFVIVTSFSIAVLAACNTNNNEAAEYTGTSELEQASDTLGLIAKQEWEQLKANVQETTRQVHDSIDMLRQRADTAGSQLKLQYNQRIAELQYRRDELNKKAEGYKYESNEKWGEFKREFKHDLDELGKALKNAAVDNVK